MHTYEGCIKELASITSEDVAYFIEDKRIDMTEQEFRDFCDSVSSAFGWYLAEGKARELIETYWYEWERSQR